MRWVFGLGGILLTLLFIVIMLSVKGGPGDYMATTLKKGQQAQGEAREIAGVDENGVHNGESITLDPVASGSRTTGLLVSALMPGGPMETHFGLKASDTILEVGPQRVRDIDDPEMAKALVIEASQRKWELIVDRGGTKLRLPGAVPVDGSAAPVVATPTPAAPSVAATPNANAVDPNATATPAPAPPKRSSIYDQVNQIPGVQR